MALIHWWPLNGDTKDYGLNPVDLVNHNATVSTSGKIGKCYSFTTSQYMDTSSLEFSSLTNCSICFWFKISTSDGSWLPFTGQSGNQYMLATASGTGNFYHANIGSNTLKIYCDGVIRANPNNDGNWHHYCITGVSLASWTSFHINWYGSNSADNGWNWNGSMNDVRIYDHALSKKEVKEISKGLILHYDFEDEEIEGTTNLASTPTNMGNWGTYANLTTTEISSNGTPVPTSTVKLSKFDVTTSGGNSFASASTVTVSPSSTYCISIYIKTNCPFHANYLYWRKYNSSGTQISEQGFASTTNREDLGSGWYRYWAVVTTDANTVKASFQTYFYPGAGTNYYVYYGAPQMEQKDHVTAYVKGTRTGIVKDASGYNYNGTPTSSIQILDDGYIGKKIVYFDGSIGAIQTPSLADLIHDGIYTLIGYFRHTDAWSSKGYETLYGGPSGFEIEAKPGSSNTPQFSPHNWGGSGSTSYRYTYTLNEWHQWVMVRTGSGSKFYIDGVFRFDGSGAGSIPAGNYFIGSWRDANSQNYKGYISDFKIYATALSATDIQKEYQSMANIDKKYNLTGKVFEEKATPNFGYNASKAIDQKKAFDSHFNAVSEASYRASYPQPNSNALGTYTQSNLSVTLTDNGVRIYSAPNLTRSANGDTMWGGLCWSPMKTYYMCLQNNHRYLLTYHIKGKSSRAFDNGRPYFTNMVGWGQSPDAAPTTNAHQSMPAGFNGEMDCYWDFTISDTVFKTTGSSVHSGFTANTSYLAYSSIKFGFTYADTGSLGTDIYITNIGLRDITGLNPKDYFTSNNGLKQTGVFNCLELDEVEKFKDYKFIEYLQSSGSQYINTGLQMNATTIPQFKVLIDQTITKNTSVWPVSGIGGGNPCVYVGVSTSGDFAYGSGAGDVRTGVTYTDNTRLSYYLDIPDKKYKISGAQTLDISISTTISGSSWRNYTLFGWNDTGNTCHTTSIKMYRCIMWQGNSVVRYFVPVKRKSDSVLGMLDTTTGTFYTNAGSGSFTAGPELDYNPFFKTYDNGKLIANQFYEY